MTYANDEVPALRTDAFRWGVLLLSSAAVVILAALGFEYIGGYVPCPLCLQQRYAYYVGIPLIGLALWSLRAGKTQAASLLMVAAAVLFAVNAGLGVYHAGAEWGDWPGPQSCATAQPLPPNAADLLKDLAKSQIVRCDEATWRFLWLSFAGWNAAFSALIAAGTLRIAYICGHDGV
ncbi:MAG TPA: disulfide bond formation protein B [Hyphomicrobiaceae bacterium]|nr:disulfide bond formation protein B [Hyphomicrobiaceae bacterium]